MPLPPDRRSRPVPPDTKSPPSLPHIRSHPVVAVPAIGRGRADEHVGAGPRPQTLPTRLCLEPVGVIGGARCTERPDGHQIDDRGRAELGRLAGVRGLCARTRMRRRDSSSGRPSPSMSPGPATERPAWSPGRAHGGRILARPRAPGRVRRPCPSTRRPSRRRPGRARSSRSRNSTRGAHHEVRQPVAVDITASSTAAPTPLPRRAPAMRKPRVPSRPSSISARDGDPKTTHAEPGPGVRRAGMNRRPDREVREPVSVDIAGPASAYPVKKLRGAVEP